MAVLTTERLTSFFGHYPARRTVGMRASVKIFQGAMVAIDSSGNAMPAGLLAAGSVRVIGVAAATYDNSAGAAGALECEVKVGEFKLVNNAGEPVTRALVGADCFVLDDQTVSLTSASSTRAVAGKVQSVDSDGVRVFFA
jgi:hypothetical protein